VIVPADLGLALVSGLLGGFGHCALMCGPLVAAVGLAAGQEQSARGAAGLHLLYNAGRITTYAVAGLALGALGTVMNAAGRAAGLQQVVAVLAGALMISMGLGASGLFPWARRLEGKLSGKLVGAARSLLAGRGAGRTYALGLVLGLLPCGLSWAAFVGAAATGSPVAGGLFALAFGLGTAPALLLVGSATGLLSARLRGRFHRAGGVAVALLGLLFLLRGLGVHAL